MSQISRKFSAEQQTPIIELYDSDEDTMLSPDSVPASRKATASSENYKQLTDEVMTHTRFALSDVTSEAESRVKDKVAEHTAELAARDKADEAFRSLQQSLIEKLQRRQSQHAKEIGGLAKELGTMTEKHREAVNYVKERLIEVREMEFGCDCGQCGPEDYCSEFHREIATTMSTFEQTHDRAVALLTENIALKIEKHRLDTDKITADYNKSAKRQKTSAGAKATHEAEFAGAYTRRQNNENKITAMGKIMDKHKASFC